MSSCDNPSGADNQQGRPIEDIAWLAGHIDGDGWVGLLRTKRSGKDYYRYQASTSVVTTSPDNALKVERVFKSLGATVGVTARDAYVGQDGSPRRKKWEVYVRGNDSALLVLSAIVPYMAEKRRCAELVIEYVQWRKARPDKPGGHAGNVVEGMRIFAEETMLQLRQARNRLEPSETTR